MSCPVSKDITYFDGFLMLAIQLVAIIGNCMFFVGLVKFPQMRNATNIFLCCLALADIVVALMPMSVTFAIYICQWGPQSQQDTVHRDITMAYLILDISCGTASILSLTVIAMDRYFAINWPFVHQRVIKPQTAAVAVVTVWVIALITSLLRLDDSIKRSSLTLLNIIISFIIPLVIMTFCYVNIAIIARRQMIRIAELNAAGTSHQRRSEGENEPSSDKVTSINETSVDRRSDVVKERRLGEPQSHSSNGEATLKPKKRSRFESLRRGTINAVTRIKAVGKELKAAKTLGIVMGVFIITWTPFMSINIISYIHCYPYTPKCSEMLTLKLVKYLKMLHYLSSALNPCLYVLLNRNWRLAFRRMLCCCVENRVSGESRMTFVGGW